MQKKQRIAQRPIADGINDARNPILIGRGQTPFCENVDLDHDSVQSVKGVIKMGNRPAPPAALMCRSPEQFSKLSNQIDGSTISVPGRGYGVIPYSDDQDIGGTVFPQDTSTVEFNDARGQNCEVAISFRVPDHVKLQGLPEDSNGDIRTGFDYTANGSDFIDDCFIVAQKGGDRCQPMSWAIGVVNVGDSETWEMVTGDVMGERASTYRPVFMWLDAPRYGFNDPDEFRYTITTGAPNTFGTLAMRALVLDTAIEPGKTYSFSMGLTMDSGSIAGPDKTDTHTWTGDGALNFYIAEDGGDPVLFRDGFGLHVWKGPTDSIDYIKRYGVRYAGRENMYLGLGFRMTPFLEYGNIPYGFDAAALEQGGMSLVRLNDGSSPTDPVNSDSSVFLSDHSGTDNFITIDNQDVAAASTVRSSGSSPIGPFGYSGGVTWAAWMGAGDFVSTQYNPEVLRGYRAITAGSSIYTLTLDDYTRSTSTFNLMGTWINFDDFLGGPAETVLVAFRWNQRDVIISDFRIYREPRDFTQPRAKLSLGMALDVADTTEPNTEHLLGYWPLDDGGTGLLLDNIGGNDGFTAPMQMGVSQRGTRGENQVFLSGEGEAMVLDLSENPVFRREMLANLNSGNQGFAIQFTCRLTGAEYSPPAVHADPSSVQLYPLFAPHLATWAVKDQDDTGLSVIPRDLIQFGHRARTANNNQSFRFPLGFGIEYAADTDQDDEELAVGVNPWTASPTWNVFDAPWIGEVVTFQVGVDPDPDNPGMYRVYIEATPAGILKEGGVVEGEDPSGELSLFSSNLTISRKDLERSVITVGGAWVGEEDGYQATNARMIIDEIRVFGAAAAGKLAATTGDVISDRSGKIIGGRSLPARELEAEDLLIPLGPNVNQIDVTDGSTTITSSSGANFWTKDQSDTTASLESAFVRIAGDSFEKRQDQEIADIIEEFYRIDSVTDDTATLNTPYEGQTLEGVGAKSFRVVGYTSLADDIRDISLSIAASKGFDPSVAATLDPILSGNLWFNRSPVTGDFSVRLYSPFSGVHTSQIAPLWVGGIIDPRSSPIRGLRGLNERLFAQAGATLFEVDDRWRVTRERGQDLTWLSFRGTNVGVDAVWAPLADDRVQLADANGDNRLHVDELDGTARAIDFEVDLDDIRGIQTVFQVVNPGSLSADVAADGKFEMNHWVRFVDGTPQLVIGADANYAGGAGKPVRNYWIAQGDRAIRPGERSHIRWIIEENGTGKFLKPILCINGKKVGVRVDTVQDTFTGDEWVTSSTADPGTVDSVVLIGIAKDFYREEVEFDDDTGFDGNYARPFFLSGFIHGLQGKIRKLKVGRDTQFEAANNTADSDYNFDFRNITYSGTYVETLDMDFDEGVGHKVKDDDSGNLATIHSHPFVPLFSEMEKRDQQCTFAAMGDAMFATNGGPPVVVDEDFGAKRAGLLPPSTKPDFEVERIGLWTPNVLNEDPVAPSVQENKYQSIGSSYLRQAWNREMEWESGDTFAFKGWVRMDTIMGRIPIYSARESLQSGGIAIECIDGNLRIGWWDSLLKQDTFVETSSPVFVPGRWHYIYIKKDFPDGVDNWTSADDAIVRWAPRDAQDDAGPEATKLKVSAGGTLAEVSFDSDAGNPTGTNATGLVTPTGTTYSAAAAVITASAAVFVADMVGMFMQFDGDPVLYEITVFTSTTVVTVDASPPSVGPTTAGGVFTGINLAPSTGFDTSETPDDSVYDIDLFGSQLSEIETNGVSAFNGAFSHSGFVSTSGTVFPQDSFIDQIFTNNGPGELDFTTGDVFAEIATTETNEKLEIDQGANASVNADSLFWQRQRMIQMMDGTRRVQITFFDVDQNIESNPSPQLIIDPTQEDRSNQSGAARIKLTDIPVSRQSGNVIRRVYMTLSNGSTPLLIGELQDNITDTFSVYLPENIIARGTPRSYQNGGPPRCSIVASGQGVLWYGDLEFQRDGVFFSRAYRPASVPISNFLVFDTGDSSPITGIHDTTGRVIIFKRDSMYGVTVAPGSVSQDTISRGVGTIHHNTIQTLGDRVYFVDTRGVMSMIPYGEPTRISDTIEEFFNTGIDQTAYGDVAAAINHRRDQYTFVAKEVDDDYHRARYAAEGSHAERTGMAHRFSRYKGPNLTAITTVWDRFGNSHALVAGTEEGFCVWMEREDTFLLMMGPDTAVWGDTSVTLGAAAVGDSTVTVTSGTLDGTLSGARGATLRWEASGVEQSAVILGVSGTVLILDRAITAAIAVSSTGIIGAARPTFHTPWMDAGVPDLQKTFRVLDITREITAGTLSVTSHKDLLDAVIFPMTFSLTDGVGHEDIQTIATLIQLRMQEPFASAGLEMNVSDYILRFEVSDNW